MKHCSEVFMEEWRSVLQTVQSSLETPNRVIVFGETLGRQHACWVALRHQRVHENNTNVTEQNGDVCHQNHNTLDLNPKSRTLEVCIQRICETVSPRNTLSFVLVLFFLPTPSCGPDFANDLTSRNCLTHGKTFHQEFAIHTFHHFINDGITTCLPPNKNDLSRVIQVQSG